MNKEAIKNVLLALIYTSEGKPRFVGGDVQSKLDLIDGTVDEIFFEYTKHDPSIYLGKYDLTKAGQYLSGDSYVLDDVEKIRKHPDQDDLIDSVDGVYAWEKVEFTFTCKEFLELIEVT